MCCPSCSGKGLAPSTFFVSLFRVLTSHAHLYVANPTAFGGIGEPGAIQYGHGEENPTPSN